MKSLEWIVRANTMLALSYLIPCNSSTWYQELATGMMIFGLFMTGVMCFIQSFRETK